MKQRYLKPLTMKTPYLPYSTSHHKLMIRKESITAKFIAAQQLLNTTWQFLYCQARDILTGAYVMNGCKCMKCSLQVYSL